MDNGYILGLVWRYGAWMSRDPKQNHCALFVSAVLHHDTGIVRHLQSCCALTSCHKVFAKLTHLLLGPVGTRAQNYRYGTRLRPASHTAFGIMCQWSTERSRNRLRYPTLLAQLLLALSFLALYVASLQALNHGSFWIREA